MSDPFLKVDWRFSAASVLIYIKYTKYTTRLDVIKNSGTDMINQKLLDGQQLRKSSVTKPF